MTKDELRAANHFHRVEPSELEGINEWAEWLAALLNNPCVVHEIDGVDELLEVKALVDTVGGLQIRIYPNEHPPPHFHVKSQAHDLDASFAIEDCSILHGTADGQVKKKIRYWHKRAKSKLIDAWNATRPTDCSVGAYRGT